jgi:hypothetical protein
MSAMIQRKVIRPNYRQKSQLGYSRIQLRTQGLNSADSRSKSALGPKGDMAALKCDFRYAPTSGLNSDIGPCQKHAPSKESC